MPNITDLDPCISGYHLLRVVGLLDWLGPAIWVAEGRGKHLAKDCNVEVYESARLISRVETWNDRAARIFACDCAEHVLPIWTAEYPDDHRPAKAIEVARRFANGKASAEEMTAARAAAWDAARAAAWDAARAAARAAAKAAARAAAWAAARAAAWAAAGAAARAVAGDAEKAWQTKRLCELLELEAAQ